MIERRGAAKSIAGNLKGEIYLRKCGTTRSAVGEDADEQNANRVSVKTASLNT